MINKYLFDGTPLVIIPELATRIGLNEAIILQQIHYWLLRSKHEIDGRKWIYNSIPGWKTQFPFFSESTIKRTIKKLTQAKIVLTGTYNKRKFDKTKWYTIDYEVYREFISTDDQVKMTRREGQNDLISSGQNDPTNTMILPDSTTEITSNIKRSVSEEVTSVYKAWCSSEHLVIPKKIETHIAAIEKALKKYGIDTVLKAIANYEHCLNRSVWFNYRWSLKIFMSRIDRFQDTKEAYATYIGKDYKDPVQSFLDSDVTPIGVEAE